MSDQPSESGQGNETRTVPAEPVRQFSIFLENRPGALLGVVRMLNDALVEVLGLSVQDSTDSTVVRLIASDPDTVGTRFIERGIPFTQCEMVVVELAEAAHLSTCLSALLKAETNIHFCYPLLARGGGKSALALCLEDAEFGQEVLSANGFKLLYQPDLSR